MIRTILAVVIGLVVGMVVHMGILFLSVLAYPLPEGMDMADQEAMKGFVASLPPLAFAFPLAAHAIGSLVSALICSLIVRRNWMIGSLIIGVFYLVGGAINLYSIPHPAWFAPVDLLLYIPAALVGGWIAGTLTGTKTAG